MQTDATPYAVRKALPSKAPSQSVQSTEASERLFAAYGERMTSEEVASELGYSLTYFLKKIGSEKHRHLDWVSALFPVRVRLGRTAYYPTNYVAQLLRKKGLFQ